MEIQSIQSDDSLGQLFECLSETSESDGGWFPWHQKHDRWFPQSLNLILSLNPMYLTRASIVRIPIIQHASHLLCSEGKYPLPCFQWSPHTSDCLQSWCWQVYCIWSPSKAPS